MNPSDNQNQNPIPKIDDRMTTCDQSARCAAEAPRLMEEEPIPVENSQYVDYTNESSEEDGEEEGEDDDETVWTDGSGEEKAMNEMVDQLSGRDARLEAFMEMDQSLPVSKFDRIPEDLLSNIMTEIAQSIPHITPEQMETLEKTIRMSFRWRKVDPNRIMMDDVEMMIDLWLEEAKVAYPDKYEIGRIISNHYYGYQRDRHDPFTVRELYSYTNYMDLHNIEEMYQAHFRTLKWQDRTKIEGRYVIYYLFYMINYVTKMMDALLNPDLTAELRARYTASFERRFTEKLEMMYHFIEKGYIKNRLYWGREKMTRDMNEGDDEVEELVKCNYVSIYDIFVYSVEFLKIDLVSNFFYQVMMHKLLIEKMAMSTSCNSALDLSIETTELSTKYPKQHDGDEASKEEIKFTDGFNAARPWLPAIHLIDGSGYNNEEVVNFLFRRYDQTSFYRYTPLYYMVHWAIYRSSRPNWECDPNRIYPGTQITPWSTEELFHDFVQSPVIKYDNETDVDEVHYMLNEAHYLETIDLTLSKLVLSRMVVDLKRAAEQNQITQVKEHNNMTMFFRFPIKNTRLVRLNTTTEEQGSYNIYMWKESNRHACDEGTEDDEDEDDDLRCNSVLPSGANRVDQPRSGESLMLDIEELNRKSIAPRHAHKYTTLKVMTGQFGLLIRTYLMEHFEPSSEAYQYLVQSLIKFVTTISSEQDEALAQALEHNHDCPVCLEEIDPTSKPEDKGAMVCMGCRKGFHRECMKKFIDGRGQSQSMPKCPNCRRAFYSVFLVNRDTKKELYEKILVHGL